MDKNVHFVNTCEYFNEEFRIYDIAYLTDNIIISSDIIGKLIYYEIPENTINFEKKEEKQIYPIDDLDNLISIFSIDVFNNDDIILGSSNGEIVYLKNNSVTEKYTNSKSEKFSKVKFISENIFSGGDFKGNITLFDIRQKTPIKIFKEQSEEITDILYEPNKSNFLLTSSIDSTLCVYDIKKMSLYALSDKLDEELNCMLSYKNGNHILCGSGEGNILIFNWDWFGDFKDMIRGHPEGINDMDKYDENIFLTGTEDGLIRICTMFPKAVRGLLKNRNKKGEESAMKDVNRIKISKNKKNLITCSGMDCLRMYDISQIDFSGLYKPIDQYEPEDEIEKNNNQNSDENDDDEEIKDKKKEQKNKNDEESEEREEEENDIKDSQNEEEDDEDEDEEGEENDEIEDVEEEEELEKKEEKENSEEEYNNEENDNDSEELKGKQFLNKKRKKKNSESDIESKDKKETNKDIDDNFNSDLDSDSDDSSVTKKKKSKKVKKIGMKAKSLIEKEERKAFFNDL